MRGVTMKTMVPSVRDATQAILAEMNVVGQRKRHARQPSDSGYDSFKYAAEISLIAMTIANNRGHILKRSAALDVRESSKLVQKDLYK
jgi:hypothetical protein